MGNIIAPPPAVQVAPALVLEEDSDGPALLRSHLIRCKVGRSPARAAGAVPASLT